MVKLGYKTSPIYDPPRQLDFSASLAGYFGLDTVPGAQNIAARADSNIGSLRVALNYTDVTRSLGAVDNERGVLANLALDGDYSDGGLYPRIRGGFSFGFPIGWAHSSVWLYNAAGISGGEATNPLGAYYVGSFGNNYVDDGEVKRYRAFDSLPGFAIDQIAAREFAKSLAEWNLPPLRFSNIGRPSLFLSYIRPALFAGVMADFPPTGPERTLESVGGQADLNFTVGLRLPMTLSLGLAEGLEHGQRDHTEFMLSLKIL